MATTPKQKDEKRFDFLEFLSKSFEVPVEFAAGSAEIFAQGLRAAGAEVNKDNLFDLNPYKNGLVVGAKEGLNKTFDGVSGVVNKTFDKANEALQG